MPQSSASELCVPPIRNYSRNAKKRLGEYINISSQASTIVKFNHSAYSFTTYSYCSASLPNSSVERCSNSIIGLLQTCLTLPSKTSPV